MHPIPRRSSANGKSLPAALAVAWAATLAGCAAERYEARPLEPEETVRRLVVERAAVASEGRATEVLTLEVAARWLRERGPEVLDALAAYRSALALASIETPLSNPSLELGPEWGFGDDVNSRELQPKGGVGWSFPLGDRLEQEDARNRALAEDARVGALSVHREQYLELRARFARLAAARARLAMRAGLLKSSARSIETATRLVDAGGATAIDVALFRLDHARERSRLLETEASLCEAESDLARLVAVEAASLGPLPDDVAVIPSRVPGLALLRDGLVESHPELQRRRAAYEVAERELALQISRQVPDLSIGFSGGGETGERKSVLQLGLGVDLLVFDRNQQAIAAAEQRREQARTAFESAAQRALSELERAVRVLEPLAARHRLLRDDVLPAAIENVEVARQSLAAGSADAVQMLDAQRSLRQVQLELLEAGLEELLAWIDLERAAGRPLVEFPSDPNDGGAEPPAELSSTNSADASEVHDD